MTPNPEHNTADGPGGDGLDSGEAGGGPRHTSTVERLGQLALLLLFLFALSGGIALLVQQGRPGGVEVTLPTATPAAVSVTETVDTTVTSTPPAGASPPQSQVSPLTNLNSAGLEELMALPGIGEVRAGAIIEYREQHGPFRSVDELVDVSGIGWATVDRIRPLVTVE